jgi:hypothetical protein
MLNQNQLSEMPGHTCNERESRKSDQKVTKSDIHEDYHSPDTLTKYVQAILSTVSDAELNAASESALKIAQTYLVW